MSHSGDARSRRVLVSTLYSPDGGVPEMVRFATGVLGSHGLDPVLAYYKPYSLDPQLSVPSFRLLQRGVGARVVTNAEGLETHELGAWLPELEFTAYASSRHWDEVIDSCGRHIAVSGSALAIRPLADRGLPSIAWLATPWMDDRTERVRRYPLLRKVLDYAVIQPVASRLERRLLRQSRVLALSEYTKKALNERAGGDVVRDVLPMPVDTDQFRPAPSRVRPWTVGFAGRLADPRKNVGLFLEAVRLCREAGHPARAVLLGGPLLDDPVLAKQVLRLGDSAEVHPYGKGDAFLEALQSIDAFFVPSRQEGLCIAALQAMACGCPVVSTRCGGPEEFVDAGTGALVGFDASEAADALTRIMIDRALRADLGASARRCVEERYSRPAAASILWEAFEDVFEKGRA